MQSLGTKPEFPGFRTVSTGFGPMTLWKRALMVLAENSEDVGKECFYTAK